MTLDDYLRRHADPSEAEIRDVLSGHLCRCTGYTGIVQAALEVAGTIGATNTPPPLAAEARR
jgi:2-furoyl-CoA dehydrogenase 2Fe-2S iron sulfur subunit